MTDDEVLSLYVDRSKVERWHDSEAKVAHHAAHAPGSPMARPTVNPVIPRGKHAAGQKNPPKGGVR